MITSTTELNMRTNGLVFTVLALPTVSFSLQLAAQEAPAPLAHAPRPVLSIGNYPRVNGLRLNFRDSGLERVNGINVTVWSPYEPASGSVNGIAVGLPVTGASDITGLAVAAFGVAAEHDLSGITLAPIGAGAGGRVRGIAITGIGIGAGGGLEGVAVGGIGAASGGNARGLLVGGIGAGVGGNLLGIAAGAIGVGAGGSARGLLLGGIGAAAGHDLKGIGVGGVGVGAGGDIVGLAVAGVGVGAGGIIHGVAIGGVGVGAPRIEGGFAALVVGAQRANAVVLAPAMFRIESGGSFRGGSLSAFNDIRGAQRGIAIGLVNYARSVHGAQIGVVNIIADQKSHPVLPLLNWGR